jgi:hypothetical protein
MLLVHVTEFLFAHSAITRSDLETGRVHGEEMQLTNPLWAT